jgi:hypothetical protein
MTAKANKAGETYSGAQDFTGATMTVATPSVGAQAANKTYVDGVAFSSALPGISAATAGLFVTNDGVISSWADASAVGSDIYLYNNF